MIGDNESIHRFFNRQFALRSGTKGVAFLFLRLWIFRIYNLQITRRLHAALLINPVSSMSL